MAWGVKDVSEQRLRFVVEAQQEDRNLSELCRKFGISRPTGYLWLQRYREAGRLQELGEKSRRPHRSPRRTEAALEQRVVELRKQRPDWGAPKLQVLLKREGIELPVSTIHRILLRYGLVREQDRHRSAVKRFEREAPNQLWQMDFKGMGAEHKGCLPLAILDDHSRYLVGLFALGSTEAEPVQRSLQTVFGEHGLPEAMLMDHGTPWWNTQSHWGWTWLTVWLMKQGIQLILSGYRHPQTQGKVERCNGALEAALCKRGKSGEEDWQLWLDKFRWEYNQVRPHEALGMDIPARHWKPSPKAYCALPPRWEYAAGSDIRKVRENGGVSLGGRSYFISRAFIGEYVQLQPVPRDRVVVWFCRTAIREFDLQSGASFPLDWGQNRRVLRQGFEGNTPPVRPGSAPLPRSEAGGQFS